MDRRLSDKWGKARNDFRRVWYSNWLSNLCGICKSKQSMAY